MKKLITFLLITLSQYILFSQDSMVLQSGKNDSTRYSKLVFRTAPTYTLEFNGHYDFGIYELSANNNGDFSSTQFTGGENFGVRHGFGGTILFKISIHKKGNLRLVFGGSYNRFSSKYSKLLEDLKEAGYADYNVYSISAGMENNFTPGFIFKPLIGFGVVGSFISGDARVYDRTSEQYRNIEILPAFRLGLTFYSGLEYLLNNRLGLNCGIRIVHANLWLKNTKVSDNPNEIYLNDKRVYPRVPFAGWRQFMWGGLYAGVTLYFGIEQTDYYYKKIQNSEQTSDNNYRELVLSP